MEVGERTVTATADDVMSPSWRGVLAHIHIADSASLPMRSLTTATLVAGKGIPDDRYATHSGTYSDRHHIDRQITLIEGETLDALSRDHEGEPFAVWRTHRRRGPDRTVPPRSDRR